MEIRLFQSVGNKILQTNETIIKFSEDTGVENEVINVYPSMEYQKMEGFGGAITDAAGSIFAKMNEEQKDNMLSMYFEEKNMNYQVVRIHMDSCDFATHMYSAVEDEKDIELKTFSFADTERYIIPLLDAAEKKAGKKLKIMLSAWSPPAFMKTNQSRKNGGSLKPEYRQRWAEYLCKYIEMFKNRGYNVVRMSIQNEPNAVQTWDSCVYTGEEEKVFLRDFLYPTLQKHELSDIEVFIWDHNKERLFERASEIIDDETKSMVAGLAFHWYSGDHFEALDLVREKFPDKKLILSESCLEFCKFDPAMEGVNAVRLAHDMIGNLNHGMHAFYDWNILLNMEGGPNHVGNYCDAPYLYKEETKELIPRMALSYYWHFTHFIQPGAVRIAYTKYTSKLDITAWKNPDASIVLVVLNPTNEPLTCVLRMNGKMLQFTMEPQSIASGISKEEAI
jgi:glucosylceramidase